MFRSTVMLFVALACCSDAASGGSLNQGAGDQGAGGSGATNEGAGGTNPGPPKEASDVTSAVDCYPDGAGGAVAHFCKPVVIQFSEPVPREGLTFVARTSLGDEFTGEPTDPPLVGFDLDDYEDALGGSSASHANSLVFLMPSVGGVNPGDPAPTADRFYEPTWVEVDLSANGTPIASARFEPLEYSCIEEGVFSWCWKAAPVTLDVSSR